MKTSIAVIFTAAAALAGVCSTSASAASQISSQADIAKTATPAQEQSFMTPEIIKQRGEHLRADIEKIYKEMKASNSLKPEGVGRNFITPLVLEYIPVGTSFDDAKKILLAAGCEVSGPHKDVRTGTKLSYLDSVVGIFNLSSGWMSATKFFISLIPRAIGDYSVVNEVSAEITLDSV